MVTVALAVLASGCVAEAERMASGAIDRAATTAATAELRALATAEQQHLASAGAYTDDLAALAASGFRPADDVTVTFVRVSATAYCVEATIRETTVAYDSAAGGTLPDGERC